MKTNVIYNEDCLGGMKKLPDNSIDLVLTDPPYGIDIAKSGTVGGGSYRGATTNFEISNWDNKIPPKEYFDEMFRVSKNQIIWGGNYFIDYLEPTRCMLIWYKRNGLPERTFADAEIAWTSFDKNTKVIDVRWDGFIRDSKEKKYKHPTQKALKVFEYCIKNYSSKGDIILDPFIGSGTTAVASLSLNRKFIGYEINKKYYNIALKRIGKFDKKYYEELPEEKRPAQQQLF